MRALSWMKRCISIVRIDILANWVSLRRKKWFELQKRELAFFLHYIKDNSLFFQDRIPNTISKDNCIDILKLLPVTNKQTIRENGFNYYSKEINEQWPNWLNTGGSTGTPFKFPSLIKGNYEGICQRLLYREMGSKGSLLDLIVSVDGTRISEELQQKNIYWQKEAFSFPFGKYCLSTIYMNQSTLPYYVSFLNTIKPSILRGYPSGIVELARFIESQCCRVEFKLKGIYLTSESFDKETEEIIAKVFNCKVYGQYGHTEGSIFAVKYPDKEEYLTSPLYGFTEILDENNNHVKLGETGRIVVTGFSHHGTPFVRYDTGDLGCYGGVMKDGSFIIKSLMGRTIDYVINTKNEKIFLVGFIFGGHLKAFNHINKWQIEQSEKGRITLRIVKGEGFGKSNEEEILRLFASKDIVVDIVYVEAIERTIRGKEKFLIQNIRD